MQRQLATLLLATAILAGCAEEAPPPRTVTEFVDNPILLEAAMVRCSRNRSESRYDPECVNAREAVKVVESKEEETRRAELEAESEAKRRALRRTQAAQAEARRRAQQAEERRKEAEYLAQFGVLPPSDTDTEEEQPAGNAPLAVVPEAGDGEQSGPATRGNVVPATDGGNAPVIEQAPPGDDEEQNLQDIRDELRRRNESNDSKSRP